MAFRVLVCVACFLVIECTVALIIPTPQNLPFNTGGKQSSHVQSIVKLVGLELGPLDSVEGPSGTQGLFGSPEESEGLVPFTGACSRFCVNYMGDAGKFRFISLIWSNVDIDLRGAVSSANQQRTVQLRNPNDPFQICEVHLNVDCDLPENGNNRNSGTTDLYFNEETIERNDCKLSRNDATFRTLAEKSGSRGYAVENFYVNNLVNSVSINIGGDLSRATLQIPKSAAMWQTGTTISVRKIGAKGVDIHVRAAPPGEWWLKLAGLGNSKFCFLVEGELGAEKPSGSDMSIDLLGRSNVQRDEDTSKSQYDGKIMASQMIPPMLMNVDGIWDTGSQIESRSNRKVYFERSVEEPFNENEGNQDTLQRPTGIPTPRAEAIIAYNNQSYETINDATNYNGDVANFTFITKGYQDIQGRSSIASLEDFEVTHNRTTLKLDDDISSRMVEIAADQEFTNELSRYSGDEGIDKQKMLIEVNRNSNLLVTPGTVHRVVFDVMNGCVLPVRYAFQAKSSSFRVFNLQPIYAWIYPGQTSQVAVDVVIPATVGPDSPNTLSLSIVGTEIKEKSVYLYAQGSSSRVRDNVAPTFEYSFNNNCAGKLDRNHCNRSRWSVDITVQDYDSGLKRVIASPNNIYPRANFVSGTREPATFYYSSSCCDTTARITAIDLYNNFNARTLDVTTWNNLSEAEIAAITVGALLILLLIILVVLIIVYCVRRKKSHDLPYTQRYGSRAAPQPERTSF